MKFKVLLWLVLFLAYIFPRASRQPLCGFRQEGSCSAEGCCSPLLPPFFFSISLHTQYCLVLVSGVQPSLGNHRPYNVVPLIFPAPTWTIHSDDSIVD